MVTFRPYLALVNKICRKTYEVWRIIVYMAFAQSPVKLYLSRSKIASRVDTFSVGMSSPKFSGLIAVWPGLMVSTHTRPIMAAIVVVAM